MQARRRGRDSNSRGSSPTRFRDGRTRPLCDLSSKSHYNIGRSLPQPRLAPADSSSKSKGRDIRLGLSVLACANAATQVPFPFAGRRCACVRFIKIGSDWPGLALVRGSTRAIMACCPAEVAKTSLPIGSVTSTLPSEGRGYVDAQRRQTGGHEYPRGGCQIDWLARVRPTSPCGGFRHVQPEAPPSTINSNLARPALHQRSSSTASR